MKAPLDNQTFRRLFTGRVITNVGDSLYFVAATWLVYELTGDPFYSGLAGFLVIAPQGLQALSGPLVDRWNLRRLLIATQVIQGVVILGLAVATQQGWLSVWLLLAVMPALSLVNQIVYPAQSAALPRIVDQEHLVGANSLFALAYQGTELIANAASGVLIAIVGAVTLFAIDAVTFATAAMLFAAIHIPAAASPEDVATTNAVGAGDVIADGSGTGDESECEQPSEEASESQDDPQSYRDSLRDGIDFVRGTVLVPIVIGSTIVNFVASGATIGVLPAFADGLGGPSAYGLLMAAIAGGSLVGSVLASQFEDRAFGTLAIAAFAIAGPLWIGAVAVAWLPATVALLALAFVPIGVVNVQLSALVQSVVPEHLLGRVAGLLGSASQAAVPVGALMGGAIASILGPAVVLGAGGASVLLLGVYFASLPRLRRMGPISDVGTLPSSKM